jgi:hypothetical protein
MEAGQGIVGKLCLKICNAGMPPAYGHSTILLRHELCSIVSQLHEGELTHRGALGHKLTPTPGSRHSCEDWASVLPHRRLYLKANIVLTTYQFNINLETS